MEDLHEFLEKMLENASLIIGSANSTWGFPNTRGPKAVGETPSGLVNMSNKFDDFWVHLRKHAYVHRLK